jgi:aryl-alcohol dehydrogenase-like predicted oxidoreductase
VSSALPHRVLGASGIAVSTLSLGSWETYEKIPREQALAVMAAAREAGIDFLDDARYDDRTGSAPIPTGYSEVLFGELFRAAGWKRDDVVVANKLWWEFWPRESAAQELEGSLGRMGFDYLDLAYSATPPDGLELAALVREVGALIEAGKLRAWGVLNWPHGLVDEAARVARDEGIPPPCAAQLAYNVVWRSPVEDAEVVRALEDNRVGVVASATLAYGALTGKYADGARDGRLAAQLGDPELGPALAAAAQLGELAREVGTTPAALAVAFALANPIVASVVFGATRPEQVAENVAAAELLARLRDDELAALRRVGLTPPA